MHDQNIKISLTDDEAKRLLSDSDYPCLMFGAGVDVRGAILTVDEAECFSLEGQPEIIMDIMEDLTS